MNFIFSRSLLLSALALMLLGTWVQAQKEQKTKSKSVLSDITFLIKLDNASSANNVQFEVLDVSSLGFDKKRYSNDAHGNLKKGSQTQDKFTIDNFAGYISEVYAYLYIVDPSGARIDATNGGIEIVQALFDQLDNSIDPPVLNWGVSDCIRGGKHSYCAGPGH